MKGGKRVKAKEIREKKAVTRVKVEKEAKVTKAGKVRAKGSLTLTQGKGRRTARREKQEEKEKATALGTEASLLTSTIM